MHILNYHTFQELERRGAGQRICPDGWGLCSPPGRCCGPFWKWLPPSTGSGVPTLGVSVTVTPEGHSLPACRITGPRFLSLRTAHLASPWLPGSDHFRLAACGRGSVFHGCFQHVLLCCSCLSLSGFYVFSCLCISLLPTPVHSGLTAGLFPAQPSSVSPSGTPSRSFGKSSTLPRGVSGLPPHGRWVSRSGGCRPVSELGTFSWGTLPLSCGVCANLGSSGQAGTEVSAGSSVTPWGGGRGL